MTGAARRQMTPSESISEIFASVKTQVMGGGVKPLVQYQKNPLGFLVDVLGLKRNQLVWDENAGYENHRWDGDRNPLVKLCEGLANWRDVGVEAGTGTQKSYTAAGLILWFLASWQDSQVYTFGAKEDQLKNYIWMEMSKMWPSFRVHFPEAELTDLRIRIRPGSDSWGAKGVSVGVGASEDIAAKAQGMHAEHMLLVYEEMPGILPAITEAGENTCTAAHNNRLGLGNPNHQQDPLHKFCADPSVVHVRISALDHPNVVSGDPNIVPGAVGGPSIERRARRYGIDSPHYLSRVRGISPAESADALIRSTWIDSAVARWQAAMSLAQTTGEPIPGKRAKGVDVARSENGDLSAVADFTGAVCTNIRSERCVDLAQFGEDLFADIIRDEVDPGHVGIDPIGPGYGAADLLTRLLRGHRRRTGELDMRVQELHGSYAWGGVLRAPDASDSEYIATSAQFGNLRAAMACQLGQDFQYGQIAIPPDDDLREELLALKTEERRGRTFLIEKDEIRKVLGRSPDKCDALMYGNWVRPRQKDKLRHRPLKAWEKAALPESERERERARPTSGDLNDFNGHGGAEVDLMFRRARPHLNAGRYKVPRP